MKPQTDAGTQLQRTEAEILRLNSELEAARQNLETFNYSVSHDLRAPLRHIVGYVDILQNAAGQTLNETSRRHLQIIAQSAAQMEQMLEALLEFSRMGRAEMRLAPVRLGALVKDAQRELRAENKGREITWQIGDLPEVWGDSAMLRQAIVNLLSNAAKFTRPCPQAKIEIGAQHGGAETILFVRDNGVGFDMAAAAKMFGAFQRFHPANEFEGTGIGLATVRRILQRHGGRTWAEGKVDGGATFYVALPNPAEVAARVESKGKYAAREG